jgi:hypothetical protein
MEHCACAMRNFISYSFSSSSRTVSLRVTPCNSGLSSSVRLSVPATVTGWAGPDFQRGNPRPPLDLLHPYDSARMKMTPAKPAVGNWRNNGPEMLNPPS